MLEEPKVEVLNWTHYSLAYAGNGDGSKRVISKILAYQACHPDFDFDFIACVGNSGLALGSVLSYLIDRPIWHIRNSTANRMSHTREDLTVKQILHKEMSCNVNMQTDKLRGSNYLFIDDLIASGSTFRMLKKTLDKFNANCKYFAVDYGHMNVQSELSKSTILI